MFFSADFIDGTNSSKAKKASLKVDDSTETSQELKRQQFESIVISTALLLPI